MRLYTLLLLVFSHIAFAGNATFVNLSSPIAIVAQRLNQPAVIEFIDSFTPVEALWKPTDNLCHIYVSNNSVVFKLLLDKYGTFNQELYEGMLAHEETHCIEQKQVFTDYPEVRASGYFPLSGNQSKLSEISADIMSIMYWRQYYPLSANEYINWLLQDRLIFSGVDIAHNIYPQLVEILPQIPNVVDFDKAMYLRTLTH